MKGVPNWIEIPAGTPPGSCKACPAVVFWIRTKNDKPMPVSVAVSGGKAPTTYEAGRGIAHFADCPRSKDFRRR